MTNKSNSIKCLGWVNAILPSNSKISDAIRCLNDSGLQVVMVVSESGKLLGTVTDGDIRRGLLIGYTLDADITKIINGNPLVVSQEQGNDSVLSLMQLKKIHQIPIVNGLGHVLGLHVIENLLGKQQRPHIMVIMAGGKGIRLRPHTEYCPKPLLPVGGRPMLEHIILRAKKSGIVKFKIAIHYLGEMIVEHFRDGSHLQVEIEYIREHEPLGTAGALGLLDEYPDKPFIVTNGDVLADIDYGEMIDFHVRNSAYGTMSVRNHELQHPFGVVNADGINIINIEEKPIFRTNINAGIYALSPEVLKYLVKNEYCDMPTLFERIIKDKFKTIIFPMYESWLDVGREEDLQRARLASEF